MIDVNVKRLRIGMVIVDGSRRIPVKELSPCTQRGKVHVNEKMCYDYIGTVTVLESK